MPTIRVELLAGRSEEQKRAFAQAVTEAVGRILGGSADSVHVIFQEVEPHNWATGGVPWSDKLHAPTS